MSRNFKDQLLIAKQELFSNPSARIPVCFLLDTQDSREGKPTKSSWELAEFLIKDDISRFSVEVCTVIYGAISHVGDFGSLDLRKTSPSYKTEGELFLGDALKLAREKLRGRTQEYKGAGVDYHKPWLIVMTDSHATGDKALLDKEVAEIANQQRQNQLEILTIAIGNKVDLDVLEQISPEREPYRMQDGKFTEFYSWIAANLTKVSQSLPGEDYKLDMSQAYTWKEIMSTR